MEKILITGGTGLIGTELAKILTKKGYNVNLLTRNINTKVPHNQYIWDVKNNYIDSSSLEEVKYIIHLAGANISDKRWTKRQKEEILKSRTESVDLLYKTCMKMNCWPNAFISSSAIGYYGSYTSEKIFNETDAPGDDFLAQVCSQWEQAAESFSTKGIRVVKIRTGVVLDKKNGAYAKIFKTLKHGMAAPIGNGNQYIPWIHISDIVEIFAKAIEDKNMQGIFNGVAPEHVTNKEFTLKLAKSLNKSLFMPNVPEFTLRLLFGEMADILLHGSRVSSEKIIQSGFTFRYPSLEEAFKSLASV